MKFKNAEEAIRDLIDDQSWRPEEATKFVSAVMALGREGRAQESYLTGRQDGYAKAREDLAKHFDGLADSLLPHQSIGDLEVAGRMRAIADNCRTADLT